MSEETLKRNLAAIEQAQRERSSSVKVTITMTLRQAKTLEHALNDYRDEGPPGEGWASQELAELRSIVERAVLAANLK